MAFPERSRSRSVCLRKRERHWTHRIHGGGVSPNGDATLSAPLTHPINDIKENLEWINHF
jgi:hypothetical protein